jgi:hypothetical protein
VPYGTASEDIVTEIPHSTECLVEVNDAQRKRVDHLDEDPMAVRRVGRKVPTGHVSCDRNITIAFLPKQVN